MEKRRLAIYPFNDECIVFSKFADLISDEYIFCEAAAPRSWYYSSKKINTSEGEYTVKYSINDFEHKCNTLLIPDFCDSNFADLSIAKEICKYADRFEEIISDAFFSDESLKLLNSKCKESGCVFKNLKDCDDNIKLPEISQFLCQNSVPVIAVAGMWENTDKFYVQLQLKRTLEKNGYKVSLVASKDYAELFGAHRFPEFMLCQFEPENSKPVVFSEYLFNLEKKENPDVIIVGVPGPVHTLSDKITKGYGILPYITFQSFCPDFFIYCSLYFDKKELMEEECNLCKYRLGVYPDIVHISNVNIKIDEQASMDGCSLQKIDNDAVNSIINDINEIGKVKAMDLVSDEFIDKMMQTIEDKLCHDEWNVV